MPLTCVMLDRADRIARVTLNRPAQMNAISPELLEDLWRVCEEVERDPAVKVVTLTGAGRAFCAGADLKAVRELSPDPERWASFMSLWHRVFNRLEALPQPVIAGVNGRRRGGVSSWCSCATSSWPTRRLASATNTPTSDWWRAAAAASACRAWWANAAPRS